MATTPDYLKETHTPPRQVRIGDEWFDFQAAAEVLGSERSALIRDYIAWLLRKPDAPELKRPPASAMRQIRKRGEELRQQAVATAAARKRKRS